MSNDIVTHYKMTGLSFEARWLFITLLCCASKKMNPVFRCSIEQLERLSELKKTRILTEIQKLQLNGLVGITFLEEKLMPVQIREDKRREENIPPNPQKGGGGDSWDNESTNKYWNTIQSTLFYPRHIFEEFAKEAWTIFLVSDDPKKKWDRFLAYYFKNAKDKIRQRILEDSLKKDDENFSLKKWQDDLFAEGESDV